MTDHPGWDWYQSWRGGALLLAALTVSLSLIHDGIVNSLLPFTIAVAIAVAIGDWCWCVAFEKGSDRTGGSCSAPSFRTLRCRSYRFGGPSYTRGIARRSLTQLIGSGRNRAWEAKLG